MNDVRTGIYEVATANFKQELIDKAKLVVSTLLEEIRKANAQSNEEVRGRWRERDVGGPRGCLLEVKP